MGKIILSLGLLFLPLTSISSQTTDTEEEPVKVQLASLSFVPVKWDKDSNLKTIEKMAREAAGNGAKILITPEGAVEGYLINEVRKKENKDLNLVEKFYDIAESLDGPSVKSIARLARELQVDIILGILERDEDILYNSVVWIDSKGKILHTHRKTHMAQPYYSPDFYHPGDSVQAFDTDYGRFGMMICFERQIPEVAGALALDGARILFNPSYGSRGEWNDTMLRTRARDTNTPLIFTHPLQTLVVDRKGEIMLNNNDEEGISYFELAIEPQESNKFKQRRPQVFINKISNEPKMKKKADK
jgi:predicted amidohydrolase